MQKTLPKFGAKCAVCALLLLCMVLTTFGAESYTNRTLFFSLSAVLFSGVVIYAFAPLKSGSAGRNFALGMFCTLFAVTVVCASVVNLRIGAYSVLFAIIIATMLLYTYSAEKTLSKKHWAIIIFTVAFAIRLSYVLYTGVTVRQHDVETFGSGFGHAGYIEWFYSDFKLPDFDVRNVWQFYHPPLHHIICAFILRVVTAFGVVYEKAVESLQMLTLFYSSVITVAGYKLLKEFSISKKAFICAFSIIAFHPSFIILSASVNNDILCVLFQTLALLHIVRWYKKHTVKNILKIALTVGLAMFTKLSAWMITPAIAFVFLYAFLRDKTLPKMGYIKQFCIFGGACVPIGLFWTVRNYLLFRVPPAYVPNLGNDTAQYIGFHSAFERLFNFDFSHFKNVFESWGDPYFEYNPTVAVLKTAVFGEWQIKDTTVAVLFANLLFYTSVLLAVIGIISVVANLKNKSAISVSAFIITAVVLAMFYWFCFKYPFTCSQDARYVTPLIIVEGVSVGVFLNNKSKAVNMALLLCTALFSLSTVVYYI